MYRETGISLVSLDQDKCLEISKKMRSKEGLIADRRYLFKSYIKCFVGSEAIDWICETYGVSRKEGVSIGQALLNSKLCYHIDAISGSQTQLFVDGRYYYRFQEDEFNNVLNWKRILQHDSVTDPCELSNNLLTRMLSLTEDLAKAGIYLLQTDIDPVYNSEEFKKIVIDISEYQKIDIRDLTEPEKIVFWTNTYNLLAIHAALEKGLNVDRKEYFSVPVYSIQNQLYSLNDIEFGILRANCPISKGFFSKPHFFDSDLRAIFALERPAFTINFSISCCSKSSPSILPLSKNDYENEIRLIGKEFFSKFAIISKDSITLPHKISMNRKEFGNDELEIWNNIKQYLIIESNNSRPQIRYNDDYDFSFSFTRKVILPTVKTSIHLTPSPSPESSLTTINVVNIQQVKV